MGYNIGKHRECQTCGQYGWLDGDFDQHKCPPQWNVWEESEADELNIDEMRVVFAKTEGHAAEVFAHRMSDCGPWSGKCFVGQWPTPEDPADREPAKKFEIEGSYTVAFDICEISS